MKPLHSLTALLPVLPLCALLSAPAEAAPWYRVEMMLVAYENQENIDHEMWPDVLPSPYSEEEPERPDYSWWQAPVMYKQLHSALWAGFSFPDIPAAELPAPFTQLEHLELAHAEQRINSRKDMQVVWHQAWIEPIQEEGQEVVHPLNIRLEDEFAIEISGSFTLHRSRYLHLNTDLIVQHYSLDENPALSTLTLPDSTVARDNFQLQLNHNSNESSSDENNSEENNSPFESNPAELLPTPLRAAEVKQTRRMRSNELHYIDHPMLGIVIKIPPIEDASSLNGDQ